jgi:hypothetical protein
MTFDQNILGDIRNEQPSFKLDGTCIEGVVKLTQRIMIILFSDEETETIGTGLPRALRSVTTASPEQVDNILRIALSDVVEILDATYEEDTPDDEKLADYDFTIDHDETATFDVVLTITAVSGDTTVAQLPINFTDKEN